MSITLKQPYKQDFYLCSCGVWWARHKTSISFRR